MATVETSLNIRLQAKQLESEANREQKESQRERAQAQAALRQGNRAAAAAHAMNAVRHDAAAKNLLAEASAMTAIAGDLRQAETTQQVADTLAAATKEMERLGKAVNLEELAANAEKMDAYKQRLGAAHSLLTGQGEPAVDIQAEELLQTLEEEMIQEVMVAIPSIPRIGAGPSHG